MKFGVTLSSVAHVAILSWGLLSLSGPKPLEVAEVEALPVDIVPIEAITKSVQGDKKADLDDTPAPKPTQRPEEPEPAVNTGDTDRDVQVPREAEKQAPPVETASTPSPPAAPDIVPTPQVKPEPVAIPCKKETPVPTTELAALNTPKVPVLEDPAEETPEISETGEQFAKLPDNVPKPTLRPKPPKAKSAQTTDRKKSDTTPKKAASAASKAETTNEDKIAALLNKQNPTKGGAKRSEKKAALGTRKKGNAEKLSSSEMDALRAAIEQCWSVPAGLSDAEDMRVTVKMRLTRDGAIDGRPDVSASGGEAGARRAFAGSARRAVLKCAPYSLPIEKYDTWAEVVVNFDPSQMF